MTIRLVHSLKCQPSNARGTCLLSATQPRLQNSKWQLGGPEMSVGVLKGAFPKVYGRSRQLSQSIFFDLITPFMRKVEEEKK